MSTSAKMPEETRLAGGSSMGPKYNHSQVQPNYFYNGIEHYKLTNNVTAKNWKDFMQPVKPHSAAFDQGQQLAMNSHSVSKPPPVHSLLPLSALSHTHAFWLTAPLLLFLSLGGLLEPLFAWGSAASQKAESLQLIGMSAPSGWHSGSYTAPSSLFLHFLPLPPLLFAGMPLKCQFILSLCIWIWFAYLFILFRVLPPFPKGVRGDWIEIDRCWWTNAFLSLSAVVCKRQPLFALKITDPLWKWLSLSLGVNILHWQRQLAIVIKGL